MQYDFKFLINVGQQLKHSKWNDAEISVQNDWLLDIHVHQLFTKL